MTWGCAASSQGGLLYPSSPASCRRLWGFPRLPGWPRTGGNPENREGEEFLFCCDSTVAGFQQFFPWEGKRLQTSHHPPLKDGQQPAFPSLIPADEMQAFQQGQPLPVKPPFPSEMSCRDSGWAWEWQKLSYSVPTCLSLSRNRMGEVPGFLRTVSRTRNCSRK